MTLRRPRLLAALLIAVPLCLFLAFQLALHLLKERIEAALGPAGQVESIAVGPTGVEIRGLRLPAAPSAGRATWPASDLLRAERVVVVPSLRDLFSAHIVLRSIRIEGGYLSLLRGRDQKLRVLPGLTGATANDGKAEDGGPAINIGRLELVDGAIEYFDASVARPPLKIRLERMQVTLDDLRLPDLRGKSRLRASGVLKGPQRDGRLEIDGETELASKESDIRAHLDGVDLLALKPYLVRAADTGIRRGRMDLDIHAVVRRGHLNAPGTLTLHDLELAAGGSLAGLSKSAAVGLLKDRAGSIQVRFTLDGNLDDPHFSLNEEMLVRVGAALADTLGVSLEGLTRGVGGAGGSVVRGIGEGFGKLLGR